MTTLTLPPLLASGTGIAPDGAALWIPALLMLIGTAGIVVPVLPGLLLVLGGVVLSAAMAGGSTSWIVVGVCVAVYAATVTLQYLLPGRALKEAGVSTSTLLLAAALGVVGFFVIPVLGAPVGFVLGIYLVEQGRSRDRHQAWARTTRALRAVLTSMGIELVGAVLIVSIWAVSVIAR